VKTLIFGAGPLGTLYAHLLCRSGNDVTILARRSRYDWVKAHGLVLVDESTGAEKSSRVRVTNRLASDDDYGLVIVLVRKNKLPSIFEVLATATKLGNILFMGNNALGFNEYLRSLPKEKLLFGFPHAGGGFHRQVVHYVDREQPGKKPRLAVIGEVDGRPSERTETIRSLFESSGIPVEVVSDIDGWLKYHAALVSPLANALYKHNCDNYALAGDTETLRVVVKAAKEGGRVLEALGYRKRQPFNFNFLYWLPEILSVRAVRAMLDSKFAEIAFSLHSFAARDEMKILAKEFQCLADKTCVQTPNINTLRSLIGIDS
jgi:2-dehydropantoate 2-reductase